MSEKLLITQALDERDLLKKKINKAINDLELITVVRKKDQKTMNNKTKEEFEADAKAAFQSVNDLIDRYRRIDQAIIMSNANTEIVVGGKSMTRAAAIQLRKAIIGGTGVDYDAALLRKLASCLKEATQSFASYTREADRQSENYKQGFIGRDTTKNLNEDELKALATLTDDLYPEYIDPIDIAKEIEKRSAELDELISNIETAIKISNATTYIEI